MADEQQDVFFTYQDLVARLREQGAPTALQMKVLAYCEDTSFDERAWLLSPLLWLAYQRYAISVVVDGPVIQFGKGEDFQNKLLAAACQADGVVTAVQGVRAAFSDLDLAPAMRLLFQFLEEPVQEPPPPTGWPGMQKAPRNERVATACVSMVRTFLMFSLAPNAPRVKPAALRRLLKGFSRYNTMCGECGVPGRLMERLSRCGRCRIATYCGRHCQKKGWAKHKAHCKPLEHPLAHYVTTYNGGSVSAIKVEPWQMELLEHGSSDTDMRREASQVVELMLGLSFLVDEPELPEHSAADVLEEYRVGTAEAVVAEVALRKALAPVSIELATLSLQGRAVDPCRVLRPEDLLPTLRGMTGDWYRGLERYIVKGKPSSS